MASTNDAPMRSNGKEEEIDVIVVGGGLSGLSAAMKLKQRGRSVLVLEARDRVGGRTLTEQTPLGSPVDLGGMWISDAQKKVMKLAMEFGVQPFPQYIKGKRIMEVDGKVGVYSGRIPSLRIWELADLQWSAFKINRMSRNIDIEKLSEYTELDSMSAEKWMQENIWSEAVKEVWRSASRIIFGAEMKEVSALWFCLYIKASGSVEALSEVETGNQQLRLSEGAQAISLRMAKRLQSVVLNSPVESIDQTKPGIVEVKTSTGKTYTSQFVIVACPPHMALHIKHIPMLPTAHQELLNRFPMGYTLKFSVVYETAFWREKEFSGEVVSNSPISYVVDTSSNNSRHCSLTGFFVGDLGRYWGSKDIEQRKELVLTSLTKWFGEDAAKHKEYVEKDWGKDEWSRGCPVGNPSVGTFSSFYGKHLRKPVGRIHWAGTELATEFCGFMEGAVQSGQRAAVEVERKFGQDTSNSYVPEEVTPLEMRNMWHPRTHSSMYKIAALLFFLLAIVFNFL